MTHNSERRVSERRDTDARAAISDTVVHIIGGLLLGLVINYFTVMQGLNKIDRRLVRIETVVCAPMPTPCPPLGER